MSIPVYPWLKIALWIGPLTVMWFSLVRQLSVEWSINPQYTYGWAVPFLCAYLAWQRAKRKVRWNFRSPDLQPPGSTFLPRIRPLSPLFHLLFAFVALLLLPARLIQEANPQWRTAAWFVAFVYIGLTLLAAHVAVRYFLSSGFDFQYFAFPICFFLVAVPWPTSVEAPLIQSLTRANAATTVELMGIIGVPAVQRGNMVEVTTGVVGIDDACSGIRSFQATLMIALFLGELYRLSVFRRTVLCFAGFTLSFVFNLGRTSLLTWIAAHHGVAAISKWHDPAGVTILVGCFLALWSIAVSLRSNSPPNLNPAPNSSSDPSLRTPGYALRPPPSGVPSSIFRLPHLLYFAFAVWMFLVFVGVEVWFRSHERDLKDQPIWCIAMPSELNNVTRIPFTDSVKSILRFSAAENVAWHDAAGLRWQMIFLSWSPGRIAAHAAQGHNPQGCLTSTGRKLLATSPIQTSEIQGLKLPFQHYQFQDGRQKLHVLYSLWQDHADTQEFSPQELGSLRSRLQGIRAGHRNLGQRSIEIAVWGINDATEAQATLLAELRKVVVVTQPRKNAGLLRARTLENTNAPKIEMVN